MPPAMVPIVALFNPAEPVAVVPVAANNLFSSKKSIRNLDSDVWQLRFGNAEVANGGRAEKSPLGACNLFIHRRYSTSLKSPKGVIRGALGCVLSVLGNP